MTFQELLIIPKVLYVLAVLFFAVFQPLRTDNSKMSYSASFLLHGVAMIIMWPIAGEGLRAISAVLDYVGRFMTLPIKLMSQ